MKQTHPRLKRSEYTETTAARNSTIFNYQRKCKKKNIEFLLSLEQCEEIMSRDCFYCGSPPANIARSKAGKFIYNGLDRKDSSRGYTEENVVACCEKCNLSKGPIEFNKFIEYVVRCYNFLHDEESVEEK